MNSYHDVRIGIKISETVEREQTVGTKQQFLTIMIVTTKVKRHQSKSKALLLLYSNEKNNKRTTRINTYVHVPTYMVDLIHSNWPTDFFCFRQISLVKRTSSLTSLRFSTSISPSSPAAFGSCATVFLAENAFTPKLCLPETERPPTVSRSTRGDRTQRMSPPSTLVLLHYWALGWAVKDTVG